MIIFMRPEPDITDEEVTLYAKPLHALENELRRVGAKGIRDWWVQRYPDRIEIIDMRNDRCHKQYSGPMEKLTAELSQVPDGAGPDAIIAAAQRLSPAPAKPQRRKKKQPQEATHV